MKGILKIIVLAAVTASSTAVLADDAQTAPNTTNTVSATAPAADDATLTQTAQSKLAAEPSLANKSIDVKTITP